MLPTLTQSTIGTYRQALLPASASAQVSHMDAGVAYLTRSVGTYLQGSVSNKTAGVAHLDQVSWCTPAHIPPWLWFRTSISWVLVLPIRTRSVGTYLQVFLPALGSASQKTAGVANLDQVSRSGPGKLIHTCTHSFVALVPHNRLTWALVLPNLDRSIGTYLQTIPPGLGSAPYSSTGVQD